jgi:type VI secretion system protein VasG
MGYGCIWQDLLGWLDKQPRSVRHRPQLSDIQTLMQEAWLIASLMAKSKSAASIC